MREALIDLTSPIRTGRCRHWCPLCQLWCYDADTVRHSRTTEHARGLMAADVDVWV